MACVIKSFSGKTVVDVAIDPFDFASKERFYPLKMIDALEGRFGRL